LFLSGPLGRYWIFVSRSFLHPSKRPIAARNVQLVVLFAAVGVALFALALKPMSHEHAQTKIVWKRKRTFRRRIERQYDTPSKWSKLTIFQGMARYFSNARKAMNVAYRPSRVTGVAENQKVDARLHAQQRTTGQACDAPKGVATQGKVDGVSGIGPNSPSETQTLLAQCAPGKAHVSSFCKTKMFGWLFFAVSNDNRPTLASRSR
jgi:hypothetical protein